MPAARAFTAKGERNWKDLNIRLGCLSNKALWTYFRILGQLPCHESNGVCTLLQPHFVLAMLQRRHLRHQELVRDVVKEAVRGQEDDIAILDTELVLVSRLWPVSQHLETSWIIDEGSMSHLLPDSEALWAAMIVGMECWSNAAARVTCGPPGPASPPGSRCPRCWWCRAWDQSGTASSDTPCSTRWSAACSPASRGNPDNNHSWIGDPGNRSNHENKTFSKVPRIGIKCFLIDLIGNGIFFLKFSQSWRQIFSTQSPRATTMTLDWPDENYSNWTTIDAVQSPVMLLRIAPRLNMGMIFDQRFDFMK